MMKAATKGTLTGAVFGASMWAGTGMWQFFAVTMAGVACTWVFSRPSFPQPRRRVRELVRVGIRGEPFSPACYDHDGCQWRGDGVRGQPLVLGPGKGCQHTPGKRHLDEVGHNFTRPHGPDCWCEFCVPPM